MATIKELAARVETLEELVEEKDAIMTETVIDITNYVEKNSTLMRKEEIAMFMKDIRNLISV